MSVLKEFDKFGDSLTKEARKNLKKVGKGGGTLSKTMTHEITKHKNSFSFSWLMQDYGEFVDKGVKGIGGTRKYKDGKKLATPIKWKPRRR